MLYMVAMLASLGASEAKPAVTIPADVMAEMTADVRFDDWAQRGKTFYIRTNGVIRVVTIK